MGLLTFSLWCLKRKAPIELGVMFLTDSQIHGLIETGRFFENPLVGRHVENVFYLKKLRDMVLVSGQNEVLLVLLSFF